MALRWCVKRVRWFAFKDIHALAHKPKINASGLELALALNQYEYGLVSTSVSADFVASLKLVELKTDVTPASAVRADIVHFAVLTLGL